VFVLVAICSTARGVMLFSHEIETGLPLDEEVLSFFWFTLAAVSIIPAVKPRRRRALTIWGTTAAVILIIWLALLRDASHDLALFTAFQFAITLGLLLDGLAWRRAVYALEDTLTEIGHKERGSG
jgi:hypothetical protein